MNLRNFFAELSGGACEAERSNQNSAKFCVTRLYKKGHIPDDVG